MSRSDNPPTASTVPSADDPVFQPDPELESALRELLGSPPVGLAEDVMSALGLSDELGPALREALAGPPVSVSEDVMAALGLSDELGPALREALAGPPVSVSDDVMAALGLEDGETHEGGVGTDEAGGELIAFPAAAPAATSVSPSAVEPARRSARSVWLGGLALAAAALLAVVVGTRPGAGEDFQMAENNQVAIEELEGGEQVLVQVFQMDENAPTIIFIDELSEDAGGISL